MKIPTLGGLGLQALSWRFPLFEYDNCRKYDAYCVFVRSSRDGLEQLLLLNNG
jgi:hypothetical protein